MKKENLPSKAGLQLPFQVVGLERVKGGVFGKKERQSLFNEADRPADRGAAGRDRRPPCFVRIPEANDNELRVVLSKTTSKKSVRSPKL